MTPFFRLTLGRSVTVFGQQMGMTTLTLWMAYQVDSFAGASVIQSAPSLLALLFLPFSGILADRLTHRGILVLSDSAGSLFVFLIALGLWLHPSQSQLAWGLIFIGYIGYQIASIFFGPACEALFAQVVREGERGRANSIHRGFMQVSSVFGQSASGLLFSLLGPALAMILNGFSLLSSAWLERGLPQTKSLNLESAPQIKSGGIRKEFLAGLIYIWKRKDLRRILSFAVISNAAITPVFLSLPFFLKQELMASEIQFGLLMALFTLGQVLGSFILTPFLSKFRSGLVLIFCVTILAALVFSLTQTRALPFIFGILFSMGLVLAPIGIMVMTEAQSLIDKEYMGRVMASLMTIAQCLIPLVSLGAATFLEWSWINQESLIQVCAGILALSAFLPLALGKATLKP